MMQYIKAKWDPSSPDEPTTFFFELDENRFEVRKVEQHADGSYSFASLTAASKGTFLSCEPLPLLADIDAEEEMTAWEMSAADFESMWEDAQNEQRGD